jgi:hypothetical protein
MLATRAEITMRRIRMPQTALGIYRVEVLKELAMAKLHTNFGESKILYEKFKVGSDFDRQQLAPFIAALDDDSDDICGALSNDEDRIAKYVLILLTAETIKKKPSV